MIAGMALLGAAIHAHSSFVSRAGVSIDTKEEMNFMDEGIQKGKMALMRMKKEADELPRSVFRRNPAIPQIAHIDHLKVTPHSADLTPWTLSERKKTMGGRELVMTTEIFDIRYEESDLGPLTHAERASLPPALPVPPGMKNCGVYLIRSTLLREDGSGRITEAAIACK